MTVVGCTETLLARLGDMVADHIAADPTGYVPDFAFAIGGGIVLVNQLHPERATDTVTES